VSAQERWERASQTPPKPLAQLSRVQILARIHVLREAHDTLYAQAQRDGGPMIPCVGRMYVALRELEQHLRERDAAERGEPLPLDVALAAVSQTAQRSAPPGPFAPTDKQVAFYQRLAESPVFSDEERGRALDWLATKATRQTIKDQIDWLKHQVETRQPAGVR
jgi:hypothetical protein